MSDLDSRRRATAANEKTASLGDGYRVEADFKPAARVYTARAHLLSGDTTDGRLLCNARATDGVDALEVGVEILRGIIELGQPWPDERK